MLRGMGIHRAAALSSFVIVAACSRPAPVVFKPPAPAAPVATETEAATEASEPSKVPTDLPRFGATPDADPAKAAELLQEVEMMLMEGGGTFEPGDEHWNNVLLAVTTDPGSPRARVMVAQMVNDDAFTAAQLEPLVTAADCSDCADALLNIDVEALPAAAAVVAKVTVSPQRAATDAILEFVSSGDKATAAPYFKGKKVSITTECLSCELSGEGGGGGTRKSTGAKALALLVGLHQDENLYSMEPGRVSAAARPHG